MTNQNIYKERRRCFLSNLKGHAAIIPAAKLVMHHADCEFPFRQDSDFWYLTGFDEPDAIALFLPHRPQGERYILFVLPKNPVIEVWNGFRWGEQGAINNFGVDIAHPIDQFPTLLSEYLSGAEGIAFRIGRNSDIENIVLKVWAEQLDKSPRTGFTPYSLISPCPLIHKLRLYKNEWEIQRMREAALITAKAHELARQMSCPGMNEREIQAIIEKHFLREGARGPAYGSIVASGDNACILHYTSNNSLMKDGDLLLIDAGCSLEDYYNADLTRTFPINGRFTSEQKSIYEIVLASQKVAIDCVVHGNTTEAVHFSAVRVLVEGLLELGLLKGSIDEVIENNLYAHLYMHRTGHWLGLDVHDVGAYRLGDYEVKLEPGMVLTVEPGIYISDRIPVPNGQPEINSRWKGIGIRIEDDVVVTASRPEVLTKSALKSLEEMEN